ncbi:MAG: LysR substrate-binding domain-containing protein [Acidiphilium sp.]
MKHVTLKQLRALTAVAQHGSVTVAARALNLSAPAVTLQLQLLQRQAGAPLLQRTATGMQPTRAGLEVIDAAGHIDAALRGCEINLAALAGAERGTINVGVISTAKYFAPRSLSAFASAHSGLELKLIVGNRAEIVEGLRHYELDLAIMGRPPNELAVKADMIGDHPHVIIAPPEHLLTKRHRIPPHDLSRETFLVREPGSGTRSLMESFFAEARLTPRINMQISSNETIKQAVVAGLGIAFLSGHTIEMELETNRLAVLDVIGLPIVRQWHVVYAADRTLSPAARLLCTFLTKEGRNYLPDAAFASRTDKSKPRQRSRARR